MGVPAVTRSAPDVATARRIELGACLRAYRELVGPEERGMPDRGRRRTPGLRREEVASLAGVGLSWYTWLEQGRVAASAEVVDAVARVLGIDAEGRRHLRSLTAPPPAAVAPALSGLAPLLAGWRAGPAAVLDARLDVLELNPVWPAALRGRNLLESLVTGDPALGPLEGVEPLVRALAVQLRMAANQHPEDRRLADVRAALAAAAPGLAALWECRGVGAFVPPPVTWAESPARAYLLDPVGLPGTSILTVVPCGPADPDLDDAQNAVPR
jgi:transcriptional regulator with XRE-family HTH domain